MMPAVCKLAKTAALAGSMGLVAGAGLGQSSSTTIGPLDGRSDLEPVGETRAFPGAEGFGARSLGGRRGALLYVDNQDDDGPGSLHAAVEAPGPRTVLFRVSGTIELDSSLVVQEPFFTIAGQKAPGDGIALKNGGAVTSPLVHVLTYDMILRHLRLRPGPADIPTATLDALAIGHGARNVIVDH